MTTASKDLSITQLAVYIVVLLLILYLLFAHGKRGLLGYIYLGLFCTLQLVSAGLQISKPEVETAAILSSVGLSPLLLGLAGIVHEVHQYLSRQNTENSKLGWVFQLGLHAITIAGVVLIAIGTANLTDDAGTSKYHHDLNLRRTGSIILLIAYIAIAAHISWVFLKHRSRANSLAQKLLYSTVATLPLIFARLVYTIVYSFASPNSHTFNDLNPETASISIKVVFIFLLPLLAVLSLVIGGLLSRQLPKKGRTESQWYSAEHGRNGKLDNLAPK